MNGRTVFSAYSCVRKRSPLTSSSTACLRAASPSLSAVATVLPGCITWNSSGVLDCGIHTLWPLALRRGTLSTVRVDTFLWILSSKTYVTYKE